ncbi:MAG: GAF domain-containing SpoIIE family protein phosphatase [bacterium]
MGGESLDISKLSYQDLEQILQVSKLLSSDLDLDTVLQKILSVAEDVMRAEACSIWLVESESGDLVCQIATGQVGDQVRQVYRSKRGQGIIGSVAQSGEPLLIPDAYSDSRFNPAFDKETGFKTRCMLTVPLRARGKLIGVAQVLNTHDVDRKEAVFDKMDLLKFGALADHAALGLENARLHKEILDQKLLEQDVDSAKAIQDSFLPHTFPKTPRFELAAKSVPTMGVGGDLYDVFDLGKNHIGVTIADVSGHGVSAALYMARTISELKHIAHLFDHPSEAIKTLNSVLTGQFMSGRFVTLLYWMLDIEKATLTYAGAGHPPALWSKADGSMVYLNTREGMPLGIFEDATFSQDEIELQPGDRVLMYTDGVIEAFNGQGEPLGLDGLKEIVAKHRGGPEDLINRVYDGVYAHASSDEPLDDIAMVALHMTGV